MTPMARPRYYVKVISNTQIALFWDADLTIPAKIDFNTFTGDPFVIKIQSTSTAITYVGYENPPL